jgi:dolichyl-phosphate beta-glucosyltransferase
LTFISLIIPAYNEESKIRFDTETAVDFLHKHFQQGEVIVVDDGSRDRTEAEAKKASSPSDIDVRIIRLHNNRGKGAAVKTGVLEARGDIIIYADSGTCVPYPDALPVIKRIQEGDFDTGLASRRHRGTVILRNHPLKRRVISRIFLWAARLVTGLPGWISDSQCGFKVYRGNAAKELYRESQIEGYLFEIEILLLARKKGFRIEEFPIRWTCDPDTRLRPASDVWSVLKELTQIRRRMRKEQNKEDK